MKQAALFGFSVLLACNLSAAYSSKQPAISEDSLLVPALIQGNTATVAHKSKAVAMASNGTQSNESLAEGYESAKANSTEEKDSENATEASAQEEVSEQAWKSQKEKYENWTLPEVQHLKVPGNGYKEGSPLYEKQQAMGNLTEPKPVLQAEPKTESWFDWYLNGVKSVWRNVVHYLASALVYLIFVLLSAVLYQKFPDKFTVRPSFRQPPMFPRLAAMTQFGFREGMFECANCNTDWPICLLAFCCPLIRWADTVAKSPQPMMKFWSALLAVALLAAAVPFTGGVSMYVIFYLVYVNRSRLRKLYGHSVPENKAAIQDFCCLFCCGDILGCCLLVQEAREVEVRV